MCGVTGGGDVRLLRVLLEDEPETLPGEALAAAVHEQRGFLAGFHEGSAGVVEVGDDGAGGLLVDGDGALLGALAHAADIGVGVVHVHVVDVERDEFGDPEAGRVEELEHGAVTARLGRVALHGLFEELVDLGDGEGLGERAADAWRLEALGRVTAYCAFRLHVLEE